MIKEKIVNKFSILRKIRKKQIKLFFYLKMYLDKNKYSKQILNDTLPYEMQEFKDEMINTKTGHPIKYQYNKVFNLKLAVNKINYLIIKPNETFSFYYSVKDADKKEKYKDGLGLIKGKIEYIQGGGLCQLSNLLFQMFLNSPLTIIERHTHKIKDFPDSMLDSIKGIDAAISEGFYDLKVKNETSNTFQINIKFDNEYIYGKLLTQKEMKNSYKIKNNNLRYIQDEGKIYEKVDVYRQEIKNKMVIKEEKLYTNKTQIGYELPLDIKIYKREEL